RTCVDPSLSRWSQLRRNNHLPRVEWLPRFQDHWELQSPHQLMFTKEIEISHAPVSGFWNSSLTPFITASCPKGAGLLLH
ncbi:hypothetical protein LEMLEM_LOCUS25112, partial [Lemmus lemmus]